ncbi:MAG TPA: hypothetical protein VFR24_05410 [Candidatus Angelobacter sp.]|nr:hypothetical protein [Candidatus Angelobacter sp.]
MKNNAICFLAVLLSLPLFMGCNGEQKKDQPPTNADRQRIEKEYQQNLDKLHELTSGTKQTLDGKRVPKATPSSKK